MGPRTPVNTRLGPSALDTLDAAAGRAGLSRSAAVRAAVDEWLQRQELPTWKREQMRSAESLLLDLAAWQKCWGHLVAYVPPDQDWPPDGWDGDPHTLSPPPELLTEAEMKAS